MTLLTLLTSFFTGASGGSSRTLLARVRERTGSDLSDAELEDMLAAIGEELDARVGVGGARTVELGDPSDPDSRWQRTLRLPVPADATAGLMVVEIDPGNSGDAVSETELTVADWRLLHGGRTLQRTPTGPKGASYWAPLVRVTFTPIGGARARDEATIKLMAIDLAYRGGIKAERAGDYSVTLSGDPIADREAVIAGLQKPQGGMVMA